MKLSIITINYNNQYGLLKTAESIVNQTYREFEWIVIDGGSKDGSKELIEKYSDHISYWTSEPDKGIYNAMNKGIQVAKGEYLLFLNSGDRLHSNDIINIIISELHTDDFISGDEWWVDENYNFKKLNTNPAVFHPYRLLVGTLWHQCTFIKRSLLIKHPYDESLKIVSDWEEMLFELVIKNNRYRHINYIISDYLFGGVSENNIKSKEERKSVLDKYLSKKEQHTIALEHLSLYNDLKHNKQIAELAFSSLVNGWYNNREYNELFGKYKKMIFKGSMSYFVFIFLCFMGHMNFSMKLYKFIKSI